MNIFKRLVQKLTKPATLASHSTEALRDPFMRRGRLVPGSLGRTGPTLQKIKKSKAKVGALVRITPGGRHAWYESNVGLIRKQYAA